MVKIVEQNEIAGLGDVMLEAMGLTGAMAIGALLFGLVLAGVIIGYRKLRARLDPEDDMQTQPVGVSDAVRIAHSSPASRSKSLSEAIAPESMN